MIPWWAFSLSAAVLLTVVEYHYRKATGGWASILPIVMPMFLIAQYCLFRGFNGATHWVLGWVTFSGATAVIRLIMISQTSGYEVSRWDFTILGAALFLTGGLLIKMGTSP